jgi:Ca-activated chloride channel family protein
MNWIRNISAFEIGIIALFLLLYLIFFFRVWRAGKYFIRPSRLIFVKFALRAIYLALLIIALLGPSFGNTEIVNRSGGKNIHIIMDMSASMKATDLTPSRIDKVKSELINLISSLSSNRFSVMVFSDQAHWQIPLTLDVQLVRDFIQGVYPDLMPGPGSNINAPLETLALHLQSGKKKDKEVLFLITDGEFYQSADARWINTIRNAASAIIILGVGTEAGGIIPDSDSGKQTASSHLDKMELMSLSNKLNGKLFFMDNQRSDFPDIIAEIKQLPEYTTKDTPQENTQSNKYSNFLLAGILLAMVDFLIIIKLFKF